MTNAAEGGIIVAEPSAPVQTDPEHGTAAQIVLPLIEGRRSVRGFKDKAVPRATLDRILVAASRAPSGSNTQPWHVHVVLGGAKARLSKAVLDERAAGAPEPTPEYPYYPTDWPELSHRRRRQNGWELYGLLGIAKGDRAAARAWHDRNFDFFGAPVGMIVTTDRRLGQGALVDCGGFLQSLMLAARSFGLETCAQAAWAAYHATVRSELHLPPEEMVLFGIALGYEDPAARANQLRTPRADPTDFITVHE